MNKSLNQAFIKAYSKEQGSGSPQAGSSATRPASVEVEFKIEDFIVRFDTATCSVPTLPHPAARSAASSAASKPAAPATTAARPTLAATPPAAQRPIQPVAQQAAQPVAQRAAQPTAQRAAQQVAQPAVQPIVQPTVQPFIQPAAAPVAAALPRSQSASPAASPVAGSKSSVGATILNLSGRGPGQQSSSAAAASLRARELVAQRHAAETLRRTIASQMSRASQWEAQQIESFAGKFPMVSQFHPRRGAAIPEPHLAKAEPQAGGQAQRAPVAAVATPAAALRQSLSAESSEHPVVTTREDLPRTNEAPSPPASGRSSRLARESRIDDSAGAGGIFRLDRPSYAMPDQASLDHGQSDSHEDSSEILGLSTSGFDLDLEPPRSQETDERLEQAPLAESSNQPAARQPVASQPVASQPAADMSREREWSAKRVEHDLRQAKVRIFNPVWEVDNFQWPEICMELLQQRAESMEIVARNLAEACQEGLQVLAVTSTHSGAGRTTVACCLAKLAGSRGLNVAIVDGDLENPTLSTQTNLELEQDWKTAIFHQLPLEEVAVHSIEDQVTLVPLVQPIEHNELSTDDNRIERMLQELSASFDLVIVDTGHMNSPRSLVTSLGERGVLSAVVAVVDCRTTTPEQIHQCLRRIRLTGVASIGLVENFAA